MDLIVAGIAVAVLFVASLILFFRWFLGRYEFYCEVDDDEEKKM